MLGCCLDECRHLRAVLVGVTSEALAQARLRVADATVRALSGSSSPFHSSCTWQWTVDGLSLTFLPRMPAIHGEQPVVHWLMLQPSMCWSPELCGEVKVTWNETSVTSSVMTLTPQSGMTSFGSVVRAARMTFASTLAFVVSPDFSVTAMLRVSQTPPYRSVYTRPNPPGVVILPGAVIVTSWISSSSDVSWS